MIHFNKEKLVELQKQTGLTQRQLSRLTGFSQTYLSMLTNGEKPFTDNVQNKLNEAFDRIVHSAEEYERAIRDLEFRLKGLNENE